MRTLPEFEHDRARRDEKVRIRFDALRAEPIQPRHLPTTRVKVPNLHSGEMRALLYRDDGKLYLAETGRAIGRRFSTRPVLAIFDRTSACEVWTEDRYPSHDGPILIECDDVVESVRFGDR